ncbi:MAG: ankyrin repeat domain-containing protein [Kiritimatiellaeota bacterium]|nr:ankyrin repeat domain-containing protein [Kiritimatiellota bacterium]
MNKSKLLSALFLAAFMLTSCGPAKPKYASLSEAIDAGDLKSAKILIANGADVNGPGGEYELVMNDGMGHEIKMSLLMKAAIGGRTKIVETIAAAGADLNAKDENEGLNALWLAVFFGHAEVVKTLVAAGADVNTMVLGKGWNVEHYEDDPHEDESHTALMVAVQKGHAEIVNALVTAGANVNTAETHGFTALIIAADLGHADIVKTLLAAGADVNAQAHFFHSAFGKGHRKNAGHTSLMSATGKGHTEIVKTLIAAGADVNAKTSYYGETARGIAERNNFHEIVTLLDESQK